MPITASQTALVSPQRDGRRWVQELHTDQLGVVYPHWWMAQAADDLAAALSAYATQLGTDLTANEVNANVAAVVTNGSLAVITTDYSTKAQALPTLRAAYLNAARQDAIMIGDFLSSLTDAQLQSAFSMTAGQVTTLRANKLTPAASAATTIRAAVGV